MKSLACFTPRRWRVLAGLLLALIATAAQPYDLPISNMLKNGAVEIANGGTPANWVASGVNTWDTSTYVSSNHSLKLADADGPNYYYWVSAGTDAVGGANYIAEWDWKYTNVTASFVFQVRFWDGPLTGGNPTGNIIAINPFYTATGTQAAFAHQIQLVQAPAGALSADVVLWTSDAGTGDVWLDNIILRPAPNLVLNGDAEYGATVPTSWMASSANATWGTDRFASGTHSLKMTDPATATYDFWVTRAIPVFEGLTTQFNFKWAYENVTGTPPVVTIRWRGAGLDSSGYATAAILSESPCNVPSGTNYTFTANSYTLTAPAGAQFADVVLWSSNAGTGTVWLDDVEVIQLDPIGHSPLGQSVPAAKSARRLIRIDYNSLGADATRKDAMATMIQTLSGIVAQTRPEIYIAYNNYDLDWLNEMNTLYGVPNFQLTDPWELIYYFKDSLINNRLIWATYNTNSFNVAASLGGRYGAMLWEDYNGIWQKYNQPPFNMNIYDDARSSKTPTPWTQNNVLTTYGAEFNPLHMLELRAADETATGGTVHGPACYMRDYATFASMFCFFDPNKTVSANFRLTAFGTMADNGFLWGTCPLNTELDATNQDSQQKVISVGTGTTRNFPAFSSLVNADIPLTQSTHTPGNAGYNNKHYVTFILTDGTNMTQMMNNMRWRTTLWAHANRGNFPIGWSMPPTMAEICPNILKYFYANSTANDQFIAAPSGAGYVYPSSYGDKAGYAAKTAALMAKCDMRVIQINELPANGFASKNYAELMAQDQIDGALEMDDAAPFGGVWVWSNGKPIASTKYHLKQDVAGKTWQDVSTALKNTTANPGNPFYEAGYSVVVVNYWNTSLADVQSLVNSLAGTDRMVVAPEQFIATAKFYMGKSPWNFAYDKAGWELVSGEDGYAGSGSWNSANQALYMDGNDSGNTNTGANARWRKFIAAGSAQTTIEFKVRTYTSTSDANVRLRVRDLATNTWTTLVAYFRCSSTSYTTYTANITPYRNVNYEYSFELDDDADADSKILLDAIRFY